MAEGTSDLKIIFLDIDGVLNNEDTFTTINQNFFLNEDFIKAGKPLDMAHMIDDDLLARLFQIIERTGAKVVMSSSWRKFLDSESDKHILPQKGITPHLHEDWRTGNHEKGIRGQEIQDWLDSHPVDKFVILDDDSDMLVKQLPFFVHTKFETGLTEELVEYAVEILNSP